MENGSFEGNYTGSGTIKVAPGWNAFYSENEEREGQGPTTKPEYKSASVDVDDRRVIEGRQSQCFFIRWKIMDAGVYQRIHVPVGAHLSFSFLGQVWCSDSNNPMSDDGELYMRAGIGPTGHTNPFLGDVQWSPWKRGAKEFQVVDVETVAQSEFVTVFIRGWNKWKLSHNDMYVDAALLTISGGPSPSPPPPGDYPTLEEMEEMLKRVMPRMVHEAVQEELRRLHLEYG